MRLDTANGEPGLERREPAPAWQAWLETAGLAAALIAAGTLLDRHSAFLACGGLPWLALAPLLAGLRYGSVHGMACGAIQALGMAVAWRWGWASPPGSIPENVLGWLVAGLVAGQFRDAWHRRTRQLEVAADHLRLRLEGLARAHHVLRASHDRLQREAPGRPGSLRDALEAFRLELIDRPVAGTLRSLGQPILALFADHASVHAATLHPVDGEGRPGPALAALGACAGGEEDPLVRHASRLGETVSIRNVGEGSRLLAAVPLVDVDGRTHAVVAIHDMPFVALHAENLELLAVIGGHLGDAIAHSWAAALSASGERSVRWFFRSVRRAVVDARRHRVPASLVAVTVRSAHGGLASARRVAAQIAARRRLTDEAAVLSDAEGRAVAVLLLRMADASGLESYRARLWRLAQDDLGSGCRISVRGWLLTDPILPGWPGEIETSLTALVLGGDFGIPAPGSPRGGVEEAS